MVKTISQDQLDKFGIDEHGRLFWDGVRVATELDLPKLVEFAIYAGAIAAAVTAITHIIRLIWDWPSKGRR